MDDNKKEDAIKRIYKDDLYEKKNKLLKLSEMALKLRAKCENIIKKEEQKNEFDQ